MLAKIAHASSDVKIVTAPSATPGITRLLLPLADTITRHAKAPAETKIEISAKARTA